ncbi:hypothetical protein QVD17_19578 [Tagetes erecta]|uniref:Uncharacterized protein n=1 Tax=Tagetes erecta TaxID=13708 RepID=A0AAD8KK66_TARER|nr:hypothetical protein QVD17_19578 [Tagetes erecta]
MAVFHNISKRFCNQALNDSKPYLFPSQFQLQSIRTLLFHSDSKSVKLHRHSDADSGIVQINMDRPEAKNALGRIC